ncbi:DWNN domain-containing protein [Geopyxis carbonaria]|nr:DWNN domain-containing protein [Geopyxis carbonaria]
MSSSVFFKFKSQKEPSRVTFDGTGISVYELKRQIIQINRLGDGTDFDLAIYNQDTNDEYDDDTTTIPRSTSIIARRLPATKPGKGTAQRYVSGKMPVNALPNAGRREKNFGVALQPVKKAEMEVKSVPVLGEGASEEDMINAMLQSNTEQWNQTQEKLANATPVYRGGGAGGFKKNAAPAPNHPPPAPYVCYRCGARGEERHWIQLCPTNADPNYDGRPRIKRTTGIPRSFLKTVEKPPSPTRDDASSASGNPTSIMVNAEGEYVVAQPDQASWESYQKKAGTNANADAPKGSKELQDKGIECSICNKLMKDAVKTPCCGKVYCEECVQNALLESDLVCPSCEAKEILLDALVPDTETREKVDTYKNEKQGGNIQNNAGVADKPSSKSPSVAPATTTGSPPLVSNGKSSSSVPQSTVTTPIPSTASSTVSHKRPAEDDIGPEVPRGPAAMRNTSIVQPPLVQQYQNGYGHSAPNHQIYPQQSNGYQQYPHQPQQFGNGYYGGPMMNGMMNGQMGHMGMNGMGAQMNGNGYYNDHNSFGGGYNHGMNGYNGHQNYGSGPMGYSMGMNNGPYNPMMNGGGGGGGGSVPNGFMPQPPFRPTPPVAPAFQIGGSFANQQKTVFSEPFPSEEDSPYMRKPVNPHRHARPKRIRPSDFKAVGGEMM